MSLFSTGDDIDFDAAASQFPDISLDGSTDIPSIGGGGNPSASLSNSGFSFDDFNAPLEKPDTAVKVTGDDEIEKFESEFPELDIPVAQPPQQPSFGATIAPRPQPSAYTSTPILTQPIVEEETEVMRQWREKQAEEIQAREEAAKERRKETISKAEAAIDEFYEKYAAKKERNIRENKENEQEFLQQMTDSLSAGTTWERIAKLIELENSQSKTIARTGTGTTDLTRFKEILLRLKREGDSAPGAGGY